MLLFWIKKKKIAHIELGGKRIREKNIAWDWYASKYRLQALEISH